MTQTVSVPSCESNLGRSVNNFLFVESKADNKLHKRYYQNKMNLAFKETEQELDKDLVAFIKDKTDLILKSIKVYHSSHLLSKDIRIANFRSYANGLTFLVFEFENHQPLFNYTICSKADNFSRLEGRVYVKRKALRSLIQEDISSLFTYPTPEEHINSINATKIGNWIVKNKILPEKEKKVLPVSPLKYQDEERLLGMAKEVLATKYDLDAASFKITSQYLRNYKTSIFSYGLICTPSWFKDLEQEGKELISNGGYTVYALTGLHKETGEKFVAVTYAICSKEDAFVKSYGRKQCLLNFIKDKVDVYPMKQDVPSMKEALLSLAENDLQHAINVEVTSSEKNPFN